MGDAEKQPLLQQTDGNTSYVTASDNEEIAQNAGKKIQKKDFLRKMKFYFLRRNIIKQIST